MIRKIKLPELITEKAIKLEKKYNLSSQLAQELIDNKDFEMFMQNYKLPPQLIARTLIEIPKEINSRFNLPTEKIKTKHFDIIFSAIGSKKIDDSAILEILTEVAKGKEIDLNKYKKIDISNIEDEIIKLIKSNKNISPNGLMGMIMKKYRGKIDPKKVMEIIKSNLKS